MFEEFGEFFVYIRSEISRSALESRLASFPLARHRTVHECHCDAGRSQTGRGVGGAGRSAAFARKRKPFLHIGSLWQALVGQRLSLGLRRKRARCRAALPFALRPRCEFGAGSRLQRPGRMLGCLCFNERLASALHPSTEIYSV